MSLEKLTFEQWYENTIGISFEEAERCGIYDLELLRQCWYAAQRNVMD